MYKSRSRSMQRGAHYRTRESVGLQALYKEHPPALTRQERLHFEFGAVYLDSFIARLSPIVRQLSAAGFRKPKDVARLLNKRRIFTASGAHWNPRLAWFLLNLIFDRQVPRQTGQAGKPLKVSPGIRKSDRTDSPPNKSLPPTRSAPLTEAEILRRLEVLGHVRPRAKT
jgi:hypothetical protein